MTKKEYQWEHFIDDSNPKKDISTWHSKFGPEVIDRKLGIATQIRFRVLIDNPETKIFIIGNFNDWGKNDLEKYELKHTEHNLFAEIILNNIMHKDPYKFLVFQGTEKYYMQDPAGVYFDDDGNTIFWDYEDPSAYRQKHDLIDTIQRSTRILQCDLPGLIVHWQNKEGTLGHQISPKEYFKFIGESGILQHVKSLGYNTIQFLPFAQSIDGDNWKYRYLVPFQFAIQKNWGSPDDFAKMIDACHEAGIAVIGDFVIGHLPHKDYNVFGQDGELNGIQNWKNRTGKRLYMNEETPWGTMRIDYDNPHVRAFIVSSMLHFLKQYRIDGYRIDNVDGIIRYGDNGDGPDRPNGRTFLREMAKTLYEYNPFALLHYESHYYHEGEAKLLVIPMDEDDRALGATAYNSSRITYYFHTEYMPKSVDKITPWKFRDINAEKEWGRCNSTIADFHNHDAAAGLMDMRCTGSYAYDTMTVKQPHNHHHAIGKIKVMEAIISFCTEGRTLDLPQTFLIQTGTFEHDSSIRWQLAFNEASNNLTNYKTAINNLMDDKAFWPINAKNRKFLNVDDQNKILVIERRSEDSHYVVLMNLGSTVHYNYKVGLTTKDDFKLVLNADRFEYCGTGTASLPLEFKNNPSNSFELLDREIEIDKIAPYGVIVLKKKD